MEESDLEPPIRETAIDSEERAAKNALASRARDALSKGDHVTADTILNEASARFPGDPDLLKLQLRQKKQAHRVTRVHALLAEVRAANEDRRFVQSLGAFREAANLSQGFQFLRDATFETAVEEAEQLTPRNWRVAAALLREAEQLDPERLVPAGMSLGINRAERDEHIANAMAKVSSNPEEAHDSVTRALRQYPGEPGLEASLAALRIALDGKKLAQRGPSLSRLASVRSELAQAGNPDTARNFLAIGEAIAKPYGPDPEFDAILAEIADQVKRSQRAAQALAEQRTEDCLEECRLALREKPGNPLFLGLQAKAAALERAHQLAEVAVVRRLLDGGALFEAQEACRQAMERFPQCFELWTLEVEIKDRISALLEPDASAQPFSDGLEAVDAEILETHSALVVATPLALSEAESAAATAVIEVEPHPARRLFKKAMGVTSLVLAVAIVAGSIILWRVYRARMAEVPKFVLEIPPAPTNALPTGTLTIRVDVPETDVFVNDQKYLSPQGSGGLAFKVAPDTYTIRGVRAGYDNSAPVTASVQKDAETIVTLHLNPKPATLEIRGAEPGTKVRVDGVLLATAAGAGAAHALSPGRHVVELIREGFLKKVVARQLGPGETVQLSASDLQLQSTDASLLSLERQDWERANRSLSVAALQEFVRKYPASSFANAAKSDVEMLRWQSLDKNDSNSLQAFASTYSGDPYGALARTQLQKLLQAKAGQTEQSDWETLDKGNKPALESFLARHPSGAHSAPAANLIADLDRRASSLESQRAEEAAWRSVNSANRSSVEDYLTQFPQGRHRQDAQQALAALTAFEASRAESAAVLEVIRRFATAWNAKDLDSIVAIQRDLNRRILKAQLAPAKSVAMRISPVGVPEINGAQATVRCRRQADETFADGSVHQNPESIVTYVLEKRNGAWGIESVR